MHSWRPLSAREFSRHPLNAVEGLIGLIVAINALYAVIYGWLAIFPAVSDLNAAATDDRAVYVSIMLLSLGVVAGAILRFRWTPQLAAMQIAMTTLWVFVAPVAGRQTVGDLVVDAALIVIDAAILMYLFIGARPNVMFRRRVRLTEAV